MQLNQILHIYQISHQRCDSRENLTPIEEGHNQYIFTGKYNPTYSIDNICKGAPFLTFTHRALFLVITCEMYPLPIWLVALLRDSPPSTPTAARV